MAEVTKVVYITREQYITLSEILPAVNSFVSPDHPRPNKVLWTRCPGCDPTRLVFILKESH